jgi:hypothetical protein
MNRPPRNESENKKLQPPPFLPAPLVRSKRSGQLQTSH